MTFLSISPSVSLFVSLLAERLHDALDVRRKQLGHDHLPVEHVGLLARELERLLLLEAAGLERLVLAEIILDAACGVAAEVVALYSWRVVRR